jgi:type IV secretory pathway VirB10-like protein
MAGDWIKFETSTLDKPEVHVIACELDIDPDAVVGKLLRVWSWFDQHSENGDAPETLMRLLDRHTGIEGFCDAMQQAGWLVVDNSKIKLPNFHRHNGETAKKRALKNERQSRWRNKNVDTKASTSASHETSTREEKRRIKEKINKKEKSQAGDGEASTGSGGDPEKRREKEFFEKNRSKQSHNGPRDLTEIMSGLKIAAKGGV